ncbi:MAG: hypothetical protein AB1568_06865 [Thermodesulfobacteriota bacterium]
MSVSEKILEALRGGLVMSERLTTLMNKVDRMDDDLRRINDRLVRLETMFEIAGTDPKRIGRE